MFTNYISIWVLNGFKIDHLLHQFYTYLKRLMHNPDLIPPKPCSLLLNLHIFIWRIQFMQHFLVEFFRCGFSITDLYKATKLIHVLLYPPFVSLKQYICTLNPCTSLSSNSQVLYLVIHYYTMCNIHFETVT